MKWFALSLIVLGAVILFRSFKMDSTASFDDGTFLVELLGILLGGGMTAIGVVILVFVGLS